MNSLEGTKPLLPNQGTEECYGAMLVVPRKRMSQVPHLNPGFNGLHHHLGRFSGSAQSYDDFSYVSIYSSGHTRVPPL